MAIAMVLVVLTAATLVYLTETQHMAFSENPSRDIILGIDSDFGRALERILAQATTKYNTTAEINTPRILANQLFTYWIMSAQEVYAKSGLDIRTNLTSSLLQPSKSLYGYNYSARMLYNLTKLYWYYPQSISAIGASISINSVQGGYVGWQSPHTVLLNLTLCVPSIRKGSGNDLLFNAIVSKENNQPVTDLTQKNVAVYLYDPTVGVGTYCWKRGNVTQLIYNGGGNYTCDVVPQFSNPSQASSFWSYYCQFVLLIVQDNRGIIVESYSYTHIDYTIQENAIESFFPSNSLKKWETYVFDLLPNGTMYWYERKLSYSGFAPPVPLPPVKQFRVTATRLGPQDPNFVQVPYQAEVWSNNYLWPSPNFAEWRKRFENGSKLVFEVNYPPGVKQQKVRISWLDDGDTCPPVYKINITQSGPFASINNGVYNLTLYARPGYSTWVDYSISLIGFGYHTEYNLLGFDVYPMGGGYWFPDKLPGGNWTVLTGPIRCVAFRKSNVIMEPPTGKNYYDEMQHQMILYIPYNVTYFLYDMNATWLNSVRMNLAYMTPFGMIAGQQADYSLPGRNLRVRWGSLLVSNGATVNGTFSNSSNVMHRDRNYNNAQNYSYWASMYRAGYAASMFASEDLINELASYTIGGTKMDQLWVWTTADYERRVMEYDSIYWKMSGTPSYNTNPNQKIVFRAAGFLSSGGTAQTSYTNDNIWRKGGDSSAAPMKTSTGIAEPSMYYRMFLNSFAPTLSAVSFG